MFRDEKIKKDDFQLDEVNTLQSLEIASGADGMRQRHVAPKGTLASGWEKIAKTFDGGVQTAAAPDVDGETRPKILTYNPQEQLTVLAPIFALDLTAFKGQLLKHLSWTLYAAVIATVFLAWDDFDPIMPQPVDEDGAKAGAGPPRAARLLALRLDSIFELGSSDFRSLVAYVLGGELDIYHLHIPVSFPDPILARACCVHFTEVLSYLLIRKPHASSVNAVDPPPPRACDAQASWCAPLPCGTRGGRTPPRSTAARAT